MIEDLLNKIPLTITKFIEVDCPYCHNKHSKRIELALNLVKGKTNEQLKENVKDLAVAVTCWETSDHYKLDYEKLSKVVKECFYEKQEK